LQRDRRPRFSITGNARLKQLLKTISNSSINVADGGEVIGEAITQVYL
jgi:hypothetical protein